MHTFSQLLVREITLDNGAAIVCAQSFDILLPFHFKAFENLFRDHSVTLGT